MGNDTAPDALLRRFKDSFISTFLTILSIVQGIVLGYFGVLVAGNYSAYSVAQWLLAIATFIMFIDIWDNITLDTTAFIWVPDIRDAIIPFFIGIVEFFLCQAMNDLNRLGLSIWLVGFSVATWMSVMGFAHVKSHASHEPEIQTLLEIAGIKFYSRIRQGCQLTMAIMVSGLTVLSFISLPVVGTLGRPEMARSSLVTYAAIIPLLMVIGSAIVFTLFRRAVVAYARSTQQQVDDQ